MFQLWKLSGKEFRRKISLWVTLSLKRWQISWPCWLSNADRESEQIAGSRPATLTELHWSTCLLAHWWKGHAAVSLINQTVYGRCDGLLIQRFHQMGKSADIEIMWYRDCYHAEIQKPTTRYFAVRYRQLWNHWNYRPGEDSSGWFESADLPRRQAAHISDDEHTFCKLVLDDERNIIALSDSKFWEAASIQRTDDGLRSDHRCTLITLKDTQ